MSASNKITSIKPNSILIPGETDWELWELRGRPEKRQTVSTFDQLKKIPSAIALPVAHIQTFPLWIGTSEQTLIPEMLLLQLEKRGLTKLSDLHSEYPPYLTVNREPTRTLLVPSLLTNQLPDRYKNSAFRYFDSSHRLFPFTPQSITLWKELNRWCFAFVRDSQVVFTQSLSTSDLTPASIQTIANTWLQLESENALGNLLHLICWSAPSAEASLLLEKQLSLHPQIQTKPSPLLPKNHFSLTPSEMHLKQIAQKKKKRILLLSLLFLLGYGSTLGTSAWDFFKKQKEINQMEAEVAALRPTYQQVRKTSFDWEALQPALNQDRYPLELLMQSVSLLPKENARLTLFSQNKNTLILQGEAKSAEVALKFTTDLKNHPPFKSFKWETPPPKLLPNQTAQFRIEATYSYASSPE